MSAPEIFIACVANVFTRQMHFKKAGDVELGHTHPYDHMTLLARGRFKVTVNGKDSEHTAPTAVYIRAELQHTITALTDDAVAYCVHALREETGEVIPPEMVPAGSELRQVVRRSVRDRKPAAKSASRAGARASRKVAE